MYIREIAKAQGHRFVSRLYAFVTEEFIMEGCRLSVFLTMDEARQLCRMNVLLTRKTRAEAAETELNGFLSAD